VPGIIANGPAIYVAALERAADTAIRDLHARLESAATSEERNSINAQIKAVRDELERKKAAVPFSLF